MSNQLRFIFWQEIQSQLRIISVTSSVIPELDLVNKTKYFDVLIKILIVHTRNNNKSGCSQFMWQIVFCEDKFHFFFHFCSSASSALNSASANILSDIIRPLRPNLDEEVAGRLVKLIGLLTCSLTRWHASILWTKIGCLWQTFQLFLRSIKS